MGYTIPTTAELVARNLAALEARLNQTTPDADQSFNAALATTEAMAAKGHYKYAEDRVRAASALTAQDGDLDAIGNEYGCYRNVAESFEGTASLAADDGVTLNVNSVFVGPSGLQYRVKASATAPVGASGSGVVLALVCSEEGVAGNLSAGDELSIQTPVAGAGRIATITTVTVLGTEEEDDDEYRVRILDIERAEGGGGNSSDIRTWAQGVAGVKRAYPFSGPPWNSALTPYPGMRTVYVEASESINADGIAPAGLLSSVRAALLSNPDTGISREVLGMTTDTLYVQSIYRTPIYVRVVGLAVSTGSLGAAQTAIETALGVFLRRFSPFVQGLDPDFDRLDVVAATVLSREVQEILDAFGGRAQNVLFGTSVGIFIGEYALNDGEKLSLGGVTWESA